MESLWEEAITLPPFDERALVKQTQGWIEEDLAWLGLSAKQRKKKDHQLTRKIMLYNRILMSGIQSSQASVVATARYPDRLGVLSGFLGHFLNHQEAISRWHTMNIKIPSAQKSKNSMLAPLKPIATKDCTQMGSCVPVARAFLEILCSPVFPPQFMSYMRGKSSIISLFRILARNGSNSTAAGTSFPKDLWHLGVIPGITEKHETHLFGESRVKEFSNREFNIACSESDPINNLADGHPERDRLLGRFEPDWKRYLELFSGMSVKVFGCIFCFLSTHRRSACYRSFLIDTVGAILVLHCCFLSQYRRCCGR